MNISNPYYYYAYIQQLHWLLPHTSKWYIFTQLHTAYYSRAPGLTFIFVVSVRVVHLFSFLCCVVFLSSFCVLCPTLSMSLDSPLLILSLVFSSLYWTKLKQQHGWTSLPLTKSVNETVFSGMGSFPASQLYIVKWCYTVTKPKQCNQQSERI